MIMRKVYGWHALRIAIGITMLGLLLAGSANAATLTVCPRGCLYSSIQDAVNAASSGDTIIVRSGTYNENVNVNKQLTLHGIGNPLIKAVGSDSAVKLSSDGITLEGFDVTGASYPGEGIAIISNNNTVVRNNAYNNDNNGFSLFQSVNNTLVGNNASGNGYSGKNGKYGSGISLSSSFKNNLIGNNATLNKNDGISLSSSLNNTLIGNNATSNNDFGISLSSSPGNTLIGNNASGNGNGIILSSSFNNTFIGNIVNSNNGIGIYLDSSHSNFFSGNNASNNNRIGISLTSSSDNILSGNNASNNDYGILADFSSSNLIYNNIFNNKINNVLFYGSNINTWGIKKQSGTNILGGQNLGGNFWAYPNGTGFGQTCSDANSDGICDETYALDPDNMDSLPLSNRSASISFTNPTPANGTILGQNFAYINTTVSGSSTAFIDWNSSLVGWWRFNRESGENISFFRDWSKRGNNAGCSGKNCPADASGKFGKALGFDGSNDYVDAGNRSILNIKKAITIEAWINPEVAQEKCNDGISGNYGVMSKVDGPANSANWSWQLRYGAPGGCYLGFNFNGKPGGSKWVTVKQNLTPGQWYHIAGTFNGTGIYSYLNGDLMETKTISAIEGYHNRLIIGNDGWGNSFKGKIDEVRIHRRALSPEEIKASYDAGIYGLHRNFTDLVVGSYKYRAYTQNLQGNVNQTEKRAFSRVR